MVSIKSANELKKEIQEEIERRDVNMYGSSQIF